MALHSRFGQATVVIPCYNEAERLDDQGVRALIRRPDVGVLFVDDGSTDATPLRLTHLRNQSDAIEVLTLPFNAGKAEAVRQGLLLALQREPRVVAYLDADFATPPEELLGLVDAVTDEPRISVVMAARVALLGRQISRSPSRHYLGRAFATLATAVLQLPAYDTQCGAKAFRAGPQLLAALTDPFASRWIFDVELIGRLLTGGPTVSPIPASEMLEVPLSRWTEMNGSKLRMRGRVLALFELACLWLRLGRARRALADRRIHDETLSEGDSAATAAASDGESRDLDINLLIIEEEVEGIGGSPTVHTLMTVGCEEPDVDVTEDPIVISAGEVGHTLDSLVPPVERHDPVLEGAGKWLQIRDEVELPTGSDDAVRVLQPTAALEDGTGEVDQRQ